MKPEDSWVESADYAADDWRPWPTPAGWLALEELQKRGIYPWPADGWDAGIDLFRIEGALEQMVEVGLVQTARARGESLAEEISTVPALFELLLELHDRGEMKLDKDGMGGRGDSFVAWDSLFFDWSARLTEQMG